MKSKFLAALNSVNVLLGRAAGFAGWILCLPIFYSVKISRTPQLLIASLAGVTSLVLMSLNELCKDWFLKKYKKQLNNDLNKITEMKNLVQQYQESAHFNLTSKTETYAAILNKLTELNSISNFNAMPNKIVKHSTTAIDLAINMAGSASGILIHFVVPMVLFDDFTNENIIYSANGLSTLVALFSIYLTIMNSKSFWAEIEKQKMSIEENLKTLSQDLQIIPKSQNDNKIVNDFIFLSSQDHRLKDKTTIELPQFQHRK